MGGKTWSSEEEKYFWEVIVPQSQQAVRPGDRLHSWDMLATVMQEAMGEPRRRDYTRTMLYEHYYQNIKTGSHSPKAKIYVRKHKAELKAEAEREKSDSVVRAPSSLPASPVASGPASLESRPPSALSREAVSQRSSHSQESYARETPQRTALPHEAPHPVHSHPTPSHQIRLPPIQYPHPSAAQSPLTRSSLPSPPLYNRLPAPRLQPPYETSSAVDAAPRNLKRSSDVEYDRVPAKRQQLPTFEPAPYLQPHHQCPLPPPAMHIRRASEDWLRQGPTQPRSYPHPCLEPRAEPPRFDERTAVRTESRRDEYERPAPPFMDRPGPVPYGMSRFDTLVWASRVHANAAESNAAEANDSSFASSGTTSRSCSESATATDSPDGSSPQNADAAGEGEDRPRSAK